MDFKAVIALSLFLAGNVYSDNAVQVQPIPHPHQSNHDWFFEADLIYWHAEEDGLQFASKAEQLPNGEVHAKIQNIDTSWEPGFRAGVGYVFGHHDDWDLSLIYTYGYDKGSGHTKLTKPTQTITNFWHPFALGPISSKISAGWNMHLNVLDLEIGKDYFLSKKISMHPHMGLRGVLLNQDYHVDFDAIYPILDVATFVPTNLLTSTEFKADNDYKAMGIRAGSDLVWHLTKNWGISGSFSGALLFGRFIVNQFYIGATVGTVGGVPTLTPLTDFGADNYSKTRVNVDASLGIQWETEFEKWGHFLTLQLCYELSHWFNQNQLIEVTRMSISTPLTPGDTIINNQLGATLRPKHGDLGLQGVSFKARYDF